MLQLEESLLACFAGSFHSGCAHPALLRAVGGHFSIRRAHTSHTQLFNCVTAHCSVVTHRCHNAHPQLIPMMKAVQLLRADVANPTAGLTVADVPKPAPGEGQVLLEIFLRPVNPADIFRYRRRGAAVAAAAARRALCLHSSSAGNPATNLPCLSAPAAVQPDGRLPRLEAQGPACCAGPGGRVTAARSQPRFQPSAGAIARRAQHMLAVNATGKWSPAMESRVVHPLLPAAPARL